MPTYIDESGDTGLVSTGGKPYFRLAAVWVPGQGDVDSFHGGLCGLRRNLGLKIDYEFKFSKTTSTEHRRAFFNTALAGPFRFAYSQIDKREAYWSKAEGREQIWACAVEIAVALKRVYLLQEQIKNGPLRERIIVDDNSYPSFLKIIDGRFSGLKSARDPERAMTLKANFRKSHKEAMLQLVDMVCGAVGNHLDGDGSEWHDLIVGRRIDC